MYIYVYYTRAIRHTTRLRDRDRDRVENLVSHSDMDRYNDRVPIRTVSSGTRYDGRVWYCYPASGA